MGDNPKKVVVIGGFDDLRSMQVRFLEEASKLGEVHVLLWSDETFRIMEGRSPKFPLKERLYLLQALHYVQQVSVITEQIDRDTLPSVADIDPQLWVVEGRDDHVQKRASCERRGVAYHVLKEADLRGFPAMQFDLYTPPSARKKVIVTGCFDWFHSGHVKFFEEVSTLGDLYVVVGNDENVRYLKGEGHPLFRQDERRYMVQSIRYVKHALISSGNGWLDGEPEIDAIKPDIYAVNEDGDKPEKREFCAQRGLEYVVLKRKPKEGLPRRESTVLRGF